jgi:hypothetical protein
MILVQAASMTLVAMMVCPAVVRASVIGDEDSSDEPEDMETEEEVDEDGSATTSSGNKGTLIIETAGEEEAYVSIEGTEVGKTRLKDEILIGTYSVEVRTPGLPPWKGKVTVERGKTTVVTVDFNAKKMGPSTDSPMFWASLGVAAPTLILGIVFASMSSTDDKEAARLSRRLDAGEWAGEPVVEAEMARLQHDLVNFSEKQLKISVAMFVVGGLATAAAISSLFIFRREKPGSRAKIEVLSIAPVLDLKLGAVGLGIDCRF